MKKIYSVLVENRSGVLCKVAGLFYRRMFNIDSLSVGETEDANISSMTIVSTGSERTLQQIEKQLNKKLYVIKVKTFDEAGAVTLELILLKVKYNKNTRGEILEITQSMKADIINMSKTHMLIQCTDTPERVKLLLTMLQPYGIVEVARTGTVALQKCSD